MGDEISVDDKQLARRIAEVLQNRPRVVRYWDDAEDHYVDIFSASDAGNPGLQIWGTLGLSNTPLIHGERELPFRVELIGACKEPNDAFGNLLSTAAFFVQKDGWVCRPGAVFETVVEMYDLAPKLPHLYFTTPSQWPKLNATFELATKKVTWLWAFPISDAESEFHAREGDDRFKSLLKSSKADVFDLRRASIV